MTKNKIFSHGYRKFLLTRPSRDVTKEDGSYDFTGAISTHTSLAGRDRFRGSSTRMSKFLLTRPSRDVTATLTSQCTADRFLLTRPSRDVTYQALLYVDRAGISTHTSLAGRDAYRTKTVADMITISTHTSLAGRDKRPAGQD